MMDEYELRQQRHDLLFRVVVSVFYHSRRVRFLQSLNQFIGTFTLFLNGSGSLALAAYLWGKTSIEIGAVFPLFVTAFNFLWRVFSLHYRIDDAIRAGEAAADRLRQIQRDI